MVIVKAYLGPYQAYSASLYTVIRLFGDNFSIIANLMRTQFSEVFRVLRSK